MRATAVGVLGFGRIGRLHAANVATHPEARLAVVADPAFDDGLARPRDVPWTADVESVIADPQVDAVLICTPTPTHAALIRAAAGVGKQVFCEKPIDLDPVVAEEAVAAVERAGVALQVGFNRRYDPSFRRLKEVLERGEIGELGMIRIVSRDPAPPPIEYVRSSGGLFLDMTIHDFDMVRFLSGAEVEEVYALGAALGDRGIGEAGDIDTAVVSLRLDSGVLASIENSRHAGYGYDQRVELFGSRGAVEAVHRTATSTLLKVESGVRREPPLPFFVERYAEAYRAELEAFLVAVRSGAPPEVGGRDGLVPLWIGLAAMRSLASGAPEPLAAPAAETHR